MANTKKPLLCTGCAHYTTMWPQEGLCSYGVTRSVVDGSKGGGGYAKYARQPTGHCGIDAVHFSPSYSKHIAVALFVLAVLLLCGSVR